MDNNKIRERIRSVNEIGLKNIEIAKKIYEAILLFQEQLIDESNIEIRLGQNIYLTFNSNFGNDLNTILKLIDNSNTISLTGIEFLKNYLQKILDVIIQTKYDFEINEEYEIRIKNEMNVFMSIYNDRIILELKDEEEI